MRARCSTLLSSIQCPNSEDEYVLWNIDSQHGQESVQKIVQLLRTLAPSVILNKVFYKTYQKRGF